MVDEDDLRRIALSMPGAYERTSYGGIPSWRTKARIFASIRDQDGALVVWVASAEKKDALLTAEPDKLFTTPHYEVTPSSWYA